MRLHPSVRINSLHQPARPVVQRLSTHIAAFPTTGRFLVIPEVIAVADSVKASTAEGAKLIIRKFKSLIVFFTTSF